MARNQGGYDIRCLCQHHNYKKKGTSVKKLFGILCTIIVSFTSYAETMVTVNPYGYPHNIVWKVPHQLVTSFEITVTDEPVSFSSITFYSSTTDELTSVELSDENGSVVSGPFDTINGIVHMTDTVVFPVGTHIYHLWAKPGSTFTNGHVFHFSTNPSADWLGGIAQRSGTTVIAKPGNIVVGANVTVRYPQLSVSVDARGSRFVIPGSVGNAITTITLSALDSGEDVYLMALPLVLNTQNGGQASDLSNCQLYFGATALNSGVNAVNPPTVGTHMFTLDAPVIVAKGTEKTLTLKCNIGMTSKGRFSWGISALNEIVGIGRSSGMSFVCDVQTQTGPLMTIMSSPSSGARTITLTSITDEISNFTISGMAGYQYRIEESFDLMAWHTVGTLMSRNTDAFGVSLPSGRTNHPKAFYRLQETLPTSLETHQSYVVANDSSIPYRVVQAGSDNVVLGTLEFRANMFEDLQLRQIALELTTGDSADLVDQQITLWHGPTQIGYAQFGLVDQRHAVVRLTGNGVTLPQSGDTVSITLRGSFTAQSAVEGTPGTFVTVAYDGDNNGPGGNYAVGASSGSTIAGSSADISTAGLRVFRTVPTIAVTSNGGSLVAGGDLYKFTVTNPNSRDLLVTKVSFSVTTFGYGFSISNFTLYVDGIVANNSPANVDTNGILTIAFDSTSLARVVTANSTKTYTLKGAQMTPGLGPVDQLSIALLQDTAYPTLPELMGTVAEINASAEGTKYFIWTPFSTTTAVNSPWIDTQPDWANSYGLPGFPAVGQSFPVQIWTAVH
jgi:hypothetical protein